ncbi:MAG: glycoside hydrolase domain-containing protein, partial [Planctomycetota bacterium]
CRVQKVSKSRVRLTPVPAEKAVALPPPPGKDWTSPEFDDSAWMRVRGKMGFLNSRTGLVLVRGRFRLEKPADLRLDVRFQGGAVVYVNGREVARSHMPEGTISPRTVATDYPMEAYVHDDGSSKGRLLTHHPYHLHHSAKEFEQRVRKIEGAAVPASAVKAGVNVLAVEIHRAPGAEFMYRNRTGSQWARTGFDGLQLAAPPGSAVPAAPGRPEGLQVWNAGVIEKVTPADFGDPGEKVRPVRVTGPRNGAFSALFVAGSPEPIRGLEVKVSDLAGPGGKIPASAVRVRYGVQAPPMNNYTRYPERFGALEESAPAEVAVLPDVKGRKVAGHGAVQPVWFTVKVPRGAKPGLYKGKAAVSAPGSASIEVPIEAAVVGWTLPDPSEFYGVIGCFQSPDSLAAHYGVEMWSEKHWSLVERSLSLMGELGVKTLYITAQRQTHLGNEHSMIRWEKGSDGKLKPDLSIAEKYVALAAKNMGKVPIVCLYCWEQNAPNAANNPSHLTAEQRRQYEREVLITVRDPKTGKLSEEKGPEWGTPESREFWKPVVEGVKAVLAKHGMSESLMLGIAGDYKPTERSLGDMKEVTGGTPWVLHSHTIRHMLGVKAEHPVGYIAAAWGGHAWHRDPDSGRGYGWKMPFPRVMTRGFDRGAPCQRTMMEFLVTGIAKPKRGFTYGPDFGLRGVGRCGADFWSVLKAGENRRGSTLFGRYPPTSWGQLNVILWCPALFAPGKDGAVATVRSEMLRENQQEIEARAFIEKALTDDGKRGKLGEELAGRAQALLDARTRLFMPRDSSLIRSGGPERMAADLYRLAAEVAAKLGAE